MRECSKDGIASRSRLLLLLSKYRIYYSVLQIISEPLLVLIPNALVNVVVPYLTKKGGYIHTAP